MRADQMPRNSQRDNRSLPEVLRDQADEMSDREWHIRSLLNMAADRIDRSESEVDRLRAENERLREALVRIRGAGGDLGTWSSRIAADALTETEAT